MVTINGRDGGEKTWTNDYEHVNGPMGHKWSHGRHNFERPVNHLALFICHSDVIVTSQGADEYV